MTRASLLGLALLASPSCSSATLEPEVEDGTRAELVRLSFGPGERRFVELSRPSTLELPGQGRESIAWDIALQGRGVFTNGGVSGPGAAAAFGPLPAPTFLSDSAPETPLMLQDRAGGALLDWYYYVGDTHQLYSRYHVYGLRAGGRLFKLQLLGYYDEQLGAAVSAQYRIRYAEVFDDGSSGETREVAGIDASAGGSKDAGDAPSACLNLDTGNIEQLTPAQAAGVEEWHLCFRREAIAVNGGESGPRGVEAVDLQAAETSGETETEIKARTAQSERARFDAVDHAALSEVTLAWRLDGVATAFAERWLEPDSNPLAVSDAVWFVIAADGATKYLIQFEDLTGDPARELAELGIRSKVVR